MQYVNVSRGLQVKLPQSLKRMIKRGSRFAVFESDDTIMFKQVRTSILDLAKEPDENTPTLEEISDIVHEVRNKMSKEK